ncbi:beta-1,4-N-acetylglucosaminyltransferase [Nematocida sp. AWRm80]|nr:beta-1,4-N-acetylglucosaminyltransferase [Nematocida sp. AWRm80]
MPQRRVSKSLTVVLGGGGHTREMLEILKVSPFPFSFLSLIISSDDSLSLEAFKREDIVCSGISVHRISRPNFVGQKYSIFQMITSLLQSISVAISSGNDILLCNGPGISLIFALAYRILYPFRRIVYIESLTRVHSLSTTGRILQYLANLFIVQSKSLENTSYPRRVFLNIFKIEPVQNTKYNSVPN